jgi:hypothetical protein
LTDKLKATKIVGAVTIAIQKAPGVNLIDDSPLPSERMILCQVDILLAEISLKIPPFRYPHLVEQRADLGR